MPAPRTALLRLLAALAALALVTTACGGDDDGGDDDATTEETDDGGGDGGDAATGSLDDVPDPCGFVTVADLQGFFESAFDAGELTEQEVTGQRQCTWSNNDGPPVKVVSIAVGTDDSQRAAFKRGAKELFDLTRESFETSGSITAADAGLGDQSYRTAAAIYVLDGDTSYTFLSTGTSADAEAGLLAMATHVIDG